MVPQRRFPFCHESQVSLIPRDIPGDVGRGGKWQKPTLSPTKQTQNLGRSYSLFINEGVRSPSLCFVSSVSSLLLCSSTYHPSSDFTAENVPPVQLIPPDTSVSHSLHENASGPSPGRPAVCTVLAGQPHVGALPCTGAHAHQPDAQREFGGCDAPQLWTADETVPRSYTASTVKSYCVFFATYHPTPGTLLEPLRSESVTRHEYSAIFRTCRNKLWS